MGAFPSPQSIARSARSGFSSARCFSRKSFRLAPRIPWALSGICGFGSGVPGGAAGDAAGDAVGAGGRAEVWDLLQAVHGKAQARILTIAAPRAGITRTLPIPPSLAQAE